MNGPLPSNLCSPQRMWHACIAALGYLQGASILDQQGIVNVLREAVTTQKESPTEGPASEERGPAVFNRPECPFNYCDQEPPYTACESRCRHRISATGGTR